MIDPHAAHQVAYSLRRMTIRQALGMAVLALEATVTAHGWGTERYDVEAALLILKRWQATLREEERAKSAESSH